MVHAQVVAQLMGYHCSIEQGVTSAVIVYISTTASTHGAHSSIANNLILEIYSTEKKSYKSDKKSCNHKM